MGGCACVRSDRGMAGAGVTLTVLFKAGLIDQA
jgi:hypothetical protein